MNGTLLKQLALDYCCSEEDILGKENVFREFVPLEGRRIFREDDNYFKAASVGGRILAAGDRDMVSWAAERYADDTGAWFMDAGNLAVLNGRLSETSHRIREAHIFFIAEEPSSVDTSGLTVEKYLPGELERFRGDERFDEAFIFDGITRDELGVCALIDGEIAGMAGATSDSGLMWQIGVNVMKGYEGKGIGTMLVSVIKNEILSAGKLPFYGTALSHIVSQRTALAAGFCPAWAELRSERICN